MICIVCGHCCAATVKDFGQRSFSLLRCRRCGSTCDKYVEYEFTLVMIDLVLHRASAYRHILFNRLEFSDRGLPGLVWCLLLGCLGVDAFRELDADMDMHAITNGSASFGLKEMGSVLQALARAVLDTVVYNTLLALCSSVYLHLQQERASFALPYIPGVLAVSSFGKYLYLLTLVWAYTSEAMHAIDAFVLTSNIVALQAFLNCSFISSGILVCSANALRFGVWTLWT